MYHVTGNYQVKSFIYLLSAAAESFGCAAQSYQYKLSSLIFVLVNEIKII